MSLSLLLWAFHLFCKVASAALLPPLNGPQQLGQFLRIAFNSPCRVIWAMSEMQAFFFSSSSMVLPMKRQKALTLLPPLWLPPYMGCTCWTVPWNHLTSMVLCLRLLCSTRGRLPWYYTVALVLKEHCLSTPKSHIDLWENDFFLLHRTQTWVHMNLGKKGTIYLRLSSWTLPSSFSSPSRPMLNI